MTPFPIGFKYVPRITEPWPRAQEAGDLSLGEMTRRQELGRRLEGSLSQHGEGLQTTSGAQTRRQVPNPIPEPGPISYPHLPAVPDGYRGATGPA